MQQKAQEMVQDFKEQWEPIADNLAEAMEAFDDLEGGHNDSSQTCCCDHFFLGIGPTGLPL